MYLRLIEANWKRLKNRLKTLSDKRATKKEYQLTSKMRNNYSVSNPDAEEQLIVWSKK